MSRNDLSERARHNPWLMGLPLILLGFGISAGALIRTDVWYLLPNWQLYLSAAVTLLPGLVVGALGLWALYRGIPDPGIPWLGSAFMGFVLLVQVITSELVDEGEITLRPAAELGMVLLFFGAGLALLVALARRGWIRAGLFTLTAAATMGLSLFQTMTAAPFNRDDLAILAAPVGLLFGWLVVRYVSHSITHRLAALGVVGLVNVGLIFLTSSALMPWLGQRGAPSPWIPLLILLTALLLSGPVAGAILQRSGP